MREPAASQIIAGKYRLESLIGHGGMGSVWRARHETLGMPVAIKFMAPQALADNESRQRFDREARALAALRTPHIVQVLDHGVDGDTPYIVMELLEGEDLSARLALRRRLALDEVSRILSHVARALRRAHEAGITHRDLKPSNIFLARIDDEEVAKVLDFGVAKLAQAGLLTDDQLTKAGTLLGSPGYMSPEQARGKEVDFRSDLWALAVIVFRAVTGQKPFAGDSIAELVIKLCIEPRPIPTRIAPDLPPFVDRFFERAFAQNPEDRYASAVEMANAFAAMLGQPGLETSRVGASPIAGLARDLGQAVLDGAPPRAGIPIPTPTPPSHPVALPRPSPPSSASSGRAAPPRAEPRVPSPPLAAPPGVLVSPSDLATAPPAPKGASPGPKVAPPPDPPPPPAPSQGLAPLPRGSFADLGLSPTHTSEDGTAVMAVPAPQRPPEEAPPLLSIPIPPAPQPAQTGPNAGRSTLVLTASVATREPTPTPASFAGFAPSGAEASVPPSPSPVVTPLPDGALRPAPTGVPAGQITGNHRAVTPPPRAPDVRLQSPTIPRLSPPQKTAGRPHVDPKILAMAIAGAAILAIFFSLAIAGLRRRHTNALRPMDDESADPTSTAAPSGEPSAAVSATDPTTTEPPAASSSGTASEAPTADPTTTASEAPTADPTASADPAPQPVYTTPKPVYTAPKPKPSGTTTKPKPTTTGTTTKPKPTTTGKTSPAPTSTTKKKR